MRRKENSAFGIIRQKGDAICRDALTIDEMNPILKKMETFSASDLEHKTKEIGEEIICRLNRKSSFLSSFTAKSLADSLISFSLKKSGLKTSLFRFIDVLPSLRSDEELIGLFLEYMGEDLDELPLAVRQGLKSAKKGLGISPLAARSIRFIVESLANRFILGKTMEEAKDPIRRLQKTGRTFSLDLLGELTLSSSAGLSCQRKYLNLLEELKQIGNLQGRREISIKLSSLNHRLDPMDWDNALYLTLEKVRPIMKLCKKLDISIIFDMESFLYKDLIIKTFTTILQEEEFREKPMAGIAIQAYLKNSSADLDRLIDWAKMHRRPILIRLVKGAYWDFEVAYALGKNWPIPVVTNKAETDLQFETEARNLLSNPSVIYPVIGSHNIRTVSHSIALSELLGFPKSHLEFQMLYGMAEPLQLILAEMGYPIRVYCPIGEPLPGMSYLIRRIMENSANDSILVQTFSGKPVSSDLLKNPKPSDFPVQPLPPHLPSFFRNQPPLDFSLREKREEITSLLDQIASETKVKIPQYPLVINGKKIFSKKELHAANPSFPDQILGKVSQASLSDAESAVNAAVLAFPLWKKTEIEERVELLRKVSRHFQKIRTHLIALEVLEVGKTWKEADGDVCEAIDFLDYYAEEMPRLRDCYTKGYPVTSFPGENNALSIQPLGVIAAISPWNFPLALSTGMVAAGLVTGNCVILKPSSRSQILASRLVETFLAEGIPSGALQLLPGEGREIGEFLIQHADIPLITFTGSNEVGRHILETASRLKEGQKQFKRVIGEMGGKNAMIIDESADLEEAVQGVIESAFGFQGQKCSACSRVIVHQSVYREFIEKLVEVTSDLTRGDPRQPSTFLGPVIDRQAKKKIASYIELGLRQAKSVYCRNEEEPGHFIGPAIFEDVPLDSPLAKEEIFGPVLCVFKAESFDQALQIANNSLFALTGGVYTRKPSHLKKAVELFNVGNLYLNRKITGAMVGRQPFGGFNLSGLGMKTGGPDYLRQFIQVKSISENSSRRGYIPME